MAVLSDNDRADCWAQWMRESKTAIGGALTKAELRSAVNAIDQWVSDNASSFNTAIPQPARGVLTAAQKADLLVYVARKRFTSGV